MRIPGSLQRFLKRLGPYQSLSIPAVPLAIVEPLKLIALFVLGGGHVVAGALVMICAYAGSLFITERLFVLLKPKLLSMPWFAVTWQRFVTVRGKLIYWLCRTWTRLRRNVRRVPGGNTGTGFSVGWQRPHSPPLGVGWLVRTRCKWKIEPC
jgi:hypothetical protein